MIRGLAAATMLAAIGSPALAQTAPAPSEQQLRDELDAARRRIDALEARLDALQANASRPVAGAPASASAAPAASVAPSAASPEQASLGPNTPVGEAPGDFDQIPEIAALGQQGAAITRAGALTIEPQLDYTRSDRNRALFRGIELVESVLVGTFDISESKQDVVGASLGLRYGLADRLEIGVRLPFIHRSDSSVLAPVAGSTNNDSAATIASNARGDGIGDVEATLRYQVNRPSAGKPFWVANLQVVAPTGTNPFDVPRDADGRALKAATGAGFWGVTPSLTAILPTDPAVLFGSIGYTHNFGRSVDASIPPVRILRVEPGASISASAGISLAVNQRTSLNLGYAHSFAFGTRTLTMALDPNADPTPIRSKGRDLQIGRLLFGVTYRLSNASSVNWGVEVGATQDAPDVRTTLRVPISVIR